MISCHLSYSFCQNLEEFASIDKEIYSREKKPWEKLKLVSQCAFWEKIDEAKFTWFHTFVIVIEEILTMVLHFLYNFKIIIWNLTSSVNRRENIKISWISMQKCNWKFFLTISSNMQSHFLQKNFLTKNPYLNAI